MTTDDAVTVSGKASPVSQGNNGVVHAILDVLRYFSVDWYQFLLFFIVDGEYVSHRKCTLLVGLHPIIISRLCIASFRLNGVNTQIPIRLKKEEADQSTSSAKTSQKTH